MTTEIKSIPNSSSAWSILSPLTFCYKFLSEARPLASSPHAVTSVITPQSGSFISNTSPLLWVAGAAALLGTVYLIATRLVPYFFPKTPPTNPGNLGGNTTTVITPPPEGLNGLVPGSLPPSSGNLDGRTITAIPLPMRPEGHVNGVNTGLPPPPVLHHQEPQLPPPPVRPEDHVNSSGTGSPLPPKDSPEDLDEPVQPHTVKPYSPPLIRSSSSPNLVDRSESSSPDGQSPPEKRSSDGNNSKIVAAVPRSNSLVDLRPPLPSSPYSDRTGSTSSSDSEAEFPSDFSGHPPSSAMGKLVSNVHYYFTTTRHYSKWTKYRLIQEQLEHFSRTKNLQECAINREDSEAVANIANAWNDLVRALLRITPFPTPDDQYRATVECLRKVRILLISAEEDVQQRFSMQRQLVGELSYLRFSGIKIFPYCHGLIELATGRPLPKALTLDTFQEELEFRTTALKNPGKTLAMNGIACEWNKFKGTANIAFDPLLTTSNVPYQDGRITVNGRSTLLLWHGTPVTQNDPWGVGFTVVTEALSYVIPYFSRIIPEENPLSRPPVINADYVAFIEEAEKRNERILHVVLENGTQKEHGKKKMLGDESGRVKERLKLGVYHRNFFPLALRLDGEFFERHYLHQKSKVSETLTESLHSLKHRLKEQLLMPLGSSDNLTDSILYRKNMDDQLAANGFCIPQKLRDASELPENIDRLLEEVHRIYFPNVENITTLEQHQAFLILSYVHIILFMCWKMDISILEALCKDDKDRGNVIKTILKLHFLYITGKINHETLTATLTQVLARPFILQKAPIIKSRLVLLTRVIPFIKEAQTRTKADLPETIVFGGAAVQSASYTVEKPEGQTIFPNNATSRTLEEYRAFLEHHRPVQIAQCNTNLVQVLAREFVEGDDRRSRIQRTISNGASNMKILVGGTLLKPQPYAGEEETAQYYRERAHAFIVDFLRGRCEFSEEDAWNVSCSIQKGLSPMLQSRLNEIFANDSLGITVVLDESSLDNALYGISLTEENKTAKIKFAAVYNIADRNGVITKVRASMTIADLATGRAQFAYALG